MLAYVRKIIPNDDAPDFNFIEVHVIFNDDLHSPHNEAGVAIFLKKDDKMTRQEIIALAIEKAREFLSFVVGFPPTEYHRSQSFLLRSDLQEDTI